MNLWSIMRGLIVTKNANLFSIDDGKMIYKVYPSGKTKEEGIYVGDNVEFDECITKVLPRKNLLIRPPIANVDKMFIIIAPIPKPDFMLVDKILIYCDIYGIKPYIVVAKYDLDQTLYDKVKAIYGKYYKVIKVCAHKKDINELTREIEGVCTLAGQSASGKSSIINAIFDDSRLAEIGNLSRKIARGKQTTRIVNLYKLDKGYLADTAGFSYLDLSMVTDLEYQKLSSYYPDFLKARAECKYRSCLHDHGECGVIKYVEQDKIPQIRYTNYLKILDEMMSARKY